MHKDPYSSSRASIGAGRNAEAREASGWAPLAPVSSDTERKEMDSGGTWEKIRTREGGDYDGTSSHEDEPDDIVTPLCELNRIIQVIIYIRAYDVVGRGQYPIANQSAREAT
jgi:hypothetical protein